MTTRKDSKNRKLKEGESKRKDGRYQYRFTTITGKRKTIYASNLSELRKKEKEVQADLTNGIEISSEYVTVNDIYDKYFKSRKDIRDTSQQTQTALYEKHIRNSIGKKPVNEINFSLLLSFYVTLLDSVCYATIKIINSMLKQIFNFATMNNIIPDSKLTTYVMKELKKYVSEKKRKSVR